MKNKKIIVFCAIYGLLTGAFVVVDAKTFKKPVTMNNTLKVVKSLTVGTKTNLGKLFVKGEISNPVAGKKVVINDDLNVKKDLLVDGDFKVKGKFTKEITTKELADSSVTTPKIANKDVTTSKINDKAVTNDKLANDSVTAEKIKKSAVGSSEIADNAVGSDKISSKAVRSSEIATGAVGKDEIAKGAVGTSEIATGAVRTSEIANDTISKQNLNFSQRSFLKAGGDIAADGSKHKSFNNVGGDISVKRKSKGYYEITIPGVSSGDYAIATIDEVQSGQKISALLSGNNTLIVYTTGLTGSLQDHAFDFMVF
ncbi:MAG: hypothetical protein WC663_04445 [Patescibacteria group bacterium]|jgi:hypothetical protein